MITNIQNNITNVGIYEIRCTKNNKIYIGSSKNIDLRLKQHLNCLKKNKHDSRYLQFAWKKYGNNAFTVKVLENLPTGTDSQKILLVEQEYLDKLQPWKSKIGFNTSSSAIKPPNSKGKNNGMFGKKHTEEAKAKMRGPRPELTIQNKGKTMRERLNKPDWISPNIIQTPVILKHINGSIVTKTHYEWKKIKVRSDYLYNDKDKNLSSLGWYYCPKCCENKNLTCKCSQIKKHLKKCYNGNDLLELTNTNGTKKTLTRKEWYKLKVYIYALEKDSQAVSKGWMLCN